MSEEEKPKGIGCGIAVAMLLMFVALSLWGAMIHSAMLSLMAVACLLGVVAGIVIAIVERAR
jgi:hypothetical protein